MVEACSKEEYIRSTYDLYCWATRLYKELVQRLVWEFPNTVSAKQGAVIWTLTSKALIRTPTTRTHNLWKQPYVRPSEQALLGYS